MGGRGIGRASAVLVLAGVAMVAGACSAWAGQFTVVTCQGDNLRYSADAFQRMASPNMRVVNACNPGPAPRGLITRNKIRTGQKVSYGAYAAVVLRPPPGTVFTHLRWSGHGQRKECRFALEVFADVPRQSPAIKTIVKRHASARCPRPSSVTQRRVRDADLDAIDWPLKDFEFAGGATQIIQRTICKSRNGCLVTRANYVRTEVANVTVADEQPPAVSILPDTPIARGEWVRGDQPLHYSADDNVGVKRGPSMIDDVRAGQRRGSHLPSRSRRRHV